MIYDYCCQTCGKHTEAVRSVDDRNNSPSCEYCGGVTRKVISLSRLVPDMAPYFDDNLQSYVTSRQHRKELMKQQGVYEKFGQNWHTGASAKR